MRPGYGTFAAVVRTFRRNMAMMRECSAGTTVPSLYPGSGSRRCLGATQTAMIHIEFFPARWIVVSTMSLGGCFFMRTLVLIDGQNLYHLARRAWAYGPSSPHAWPLFQQTYKSRSYSEIGETSQGVDRALGTASSM